MSSKQYIFGKIITDIADYDKTKVVRITGLPNISPTFINRIDENLWINYWDDKSKSLKIDYAHEQNMFHKSNSNYWSKEKVAEFTEDILDLTKAYCKSAKLYNYTIAEPFVKEREGLLNKILN